MYCRHCGSQIEDDSIFCGNCGKQLRTGQPGKNGTFSAASLSERSREMAAKLEKQTAPRSKPKRQAPNKKRLAIGVLATAAVVLCAALFGLISPKESSRISEKKTSAGGHMEAKNGIQTIYVADGRAVSQKNSTDLGTLYAYEFSEDGLPKVSCTIYYDSAAPASVVHYAYEETGVTERYADLVMNAAELSDEEQSEQYMMIEYEMLQALEPHGVDIETMPFRLIGLKDGRVTVSYEDGFFELLNYDGQSKKVGREVYYMEKPTLQYTYTYYPDGKPQMVEYHLQDGTVVRNEYNYTTGEKPATTKYSVLQNGNSISAYLIENTYDENGMLLTNYDAVSGTTTCTYHYQKLQVPADSLQKLLSVYDYLGIPYFLAREDTVAEDTLSEKTVADALSNAKIAG